MKKTVKKLKMKKMFAVVQMIIDCEDPEDSIFEMIGIYGSKKTAQAELEKARQKFLKGIPCTGNEDPEDRLLDDCDRTYDWNVTPVKVEI